MRAIGTPAATETNKLFTAKLRGDLFGDRIDDLRFDGKNDNVGEIAQHAVVRGRLDIEFLNHGIAQLLADIARHHLIFAGQAGRGRSRA